MTLFEMKEKILALVEASDPESSTLTEDPLLALKLNDLIDRLQLELAQIKRLPRCFCCQTRAGQVLTMEQLGEQLQAQVYQLGAVSGVAYVLRAGGTQVEFLEEGQARIECFVYPGRITRDTGDDARLSLGPDCLAALPYGAAADLLKNDPTSQLGSVYAQRYEQLLRRLDPRYWVGGITIEGGVAL